ncbi:pilus assembly protein TadG-related protein [Sphingobium bisphenolivorans]|uniref:pilus assembly protein TadG-related protein n=1 Tax=Sphingobium bisphenolivorans TaxID=1335760 RepID=UPI0003A23CE3|nr:pilus assembly protein TadG-related protein [Sphingobium bisphenolivorans]
MGRGMIWRLLRDKSGNMLMLAGASLPVLMGAAGLATDTVQWTLWKRQLQREADSAALAGAYAVAQNYSASDSATADIGRLSLITLSQTPVIENAPTTGSYAGNNKAVRVVLQATQALPFSKLLGITAPVLTAEATAAVVQGGTYCAWASESTTTAGIVMQGNATVDLGCGMITNSRAANAVTAGGSSSILATPVAAVGGLQTSSNYASGTTLQPYSLPQSDPYAALPTPSPTGCGGKFSVNSNNSATVSPGCYKGFDIKGTLTMAPGIYYVDGSSFSVGAQAVLSGTGVTIILTSSNAATTPSQIATLDMNGGATVNLSATTSGTYAGILFYQDRRALDSGINKVNGNASSSFQGAFYTLSQELQFSGTSGMTTDCIQIASRRITFIGNSSITNNCPPGSGAGGFTGTRVRLVG